MDSHETDRTVIHDQSVLQGRPSGQIARASDGEGQGLAWRFKTLKETRRDARKSRTALCQSGGREGSRHLNCLEEIVRKGATMASKSAPPQLGLDSFSCPHCGALAHQHWFRVLVKSYPRSARPQVFGPDLANRVDLDQIEDRNRRANAAAFIERLSKHLLTYETHHFAVDCHWEMHNLSVSLCHSCDAFSVWIEDRLVYPVRNSEIVPHEEMPDVVREDFEEAAAIVDRSPRGAAALLRLMIQKLMPELGEKGKNINDDIASLVAKGGMDVQIQQAMDILRVVGNHAVHPGQIDLKDDKATALKLFDLLNVVIEKCIASPKRIKELFEGLPEQALKAIKKRDEK
jgi:Domain of unknown function (DUF4145)